MSLSRRYILFWSLVGGGRQSRFVSLWHDSMGQRAGAATKDINFIHHRLWSMSMKGLYYRATTTSGPMKEMVMMMAMTSDKADRYRGDMQDETR